MGPQGKNGSSGPQGPQGPPGPSIHSLLKGMDYESSGHTGFASSADIDEIRQLLNEMTLRIAELEKRILILEGGQP